MFWEIQDGRQDDWWRGLEMEFANYLMYNSVQYHFPDWYGNGKSAMTLIKCWFASWIKTVYKKRYFDKQKWTVCVTTQNQCMTPNNSFWRNLLCHLTPYCLFWLVISASAVNKHSTPLQIAHGVYSCRKKTMMHMMIDQFYFVIFWQSV